MLLLARPGRGLHWRWNLLGPPTWEAVAPMSAPGRHRCRPYMAAKPLMWLRDQDRRRSHDDEVHARRPRSNIDRDLPTERPA